MTRLASENPVSERVALAVAEGVATVTLIRTAQMNAIDKPMHEGLRAAFEQIACDTSIGAVILTGSGRAFCAGQDLGERATAFEQGAPPDLYASLEERYNPLVRTLAALPVPVIAAVNGIAYGGGAAIAIACDIVLAAGSARFQFGFVNVGLGPDSGASWFLPRLVGQQRALELVLTGRPVSAEEALGIGLVSRVLPDEELMPAAAGMAAALAAASPDAVRHIKRLLRANPSLSLGEALDAERDAQAELSRTRAYRDAVLRFARKERK